MARQERQAEVGIICAAKRHGKSTIAEKLIAKNSFPNALIYKEGVNVYDEAFKKYKVLEDIHKYEGGKVIVNGGYIDYRVFMGMCYDYFRNGVLLIDDAASYESDVITPEIKRICIDSRKLGIDLVLIYHGFSDVPIKFFPYINWIILGHTTDNFEYKAKKLPGGGAELLEAKKRITAEVQKGNRYYKEFIRLS